MGSEINVPVLCAEDPCMVAPVCKHVFKAAADEPAAVTMGKIVEDDPCRRRERSRPHPTAGETAGPVDKPVVGDNDTRARANGPQLINRRLAGKSGIGTAALGRAYFQIRRQEYARALDAEHEIAELPLDPHMGAQKARVLIMGKACDWEGAKRPVHILARSSPSPINADVESGPVVDRHRRDRSLHDRPRHVRRNCRGRQQDCRSRCEEELSHRHSLSILESPSPCQALNTTNPVRGLLRPGHNSQDSKGGTAPLWGRNRSAVTDYSQSLTWR